MKREAGIAFLAYAAATAFVFWPYLFRGRVVFETGTLYHVMPHTLGPPPGNQLEPHSNDNIGHYGTILSFLSRHLRRGEFVYWNPYTYGGHPMHAANLYPPFSPVLLPPLLVLPWIDALHVSSMICITLAGLFFFMLARSLRHSFAGSLVGGAIWSLSSFTAFFIIGPGNFPTLLFLPLELLLLRRAATADHYRGYGLLGLIAGADYLSTGLQFFAMNMAICAVAALIFSRRRGHLIATAAAIAGGILVAGPVLLPFVELLGYSTRVDATSNLAQANPRSVLLILTTAFPRAYGGVQEATNLYPVVGTRELFFNLHIGTVGTLSLLLALFGSGRRKRATILAAAVAVILVVMAVPPAMKLVSKLPVLRMTSTYYLWHPMIFALALAAAGGAHRLLLLRDRDRRVVRWVVRFSLGVSAVLAGFSGIHLAGALGWTTLDYRASRIVWWFGLHNGVFALPLFTLLGLSALILSRRPGRRLRLWLAVSLALFETALFVHQNQPFSERRYVYAATGLERFADEPGRILVRRKIQWWFSRAPNVGMAYRLRTPEIHNPLRPRFGEELMRACTGSAGESTYSRSAGVSEASIHSLRTACVAVVAAHDVDYPHLEPAGEAGPYRLYRVPDAVPRAYVVHDARVVADRESRLTMLGRADFPLGETVVLEEGSPASYAAAVAPAAEIREDGADQVVVEARTSAPGYLVLRDTWYPGWEATVDGAPAAVLKADHAYRAVFIAEPGSHTVEFRYRPRSVRVGFVLALVGLALLAAISLRPRRRGPASGPEGPARG